MEAVCPISDGTGCDTGVADYLPAVAARSINPGCRGGDPTADGSGMSLAATINSQDDP